MSFSLPKNPSKTEYRQEPFSPQISADQANSLDGILRCSRYAFGPNRLHYCGPDANREIFDYIKGGASNPGLEILLKGFRTMYPYLCHIAEANGIRNPFDSRVVEAYWIGNELLETVEKKKFWRHLLEDQKIKKRVGAQAFEFITNAIARGAVPHHSFHVLDIWKRTGHLEQEHTLESMDSCRISCGTVTRTDGPFIFVKTEPLALVAGKLVLGEPIEKKIARSIDSDISIDELRGGDVVSMHWDVICEKITAQNAAALKKYTLRHIELANKTV